MIQSTTARTATATSSRLLTALRVLPATMLLAGALSFAPSLATDAGATGCHVAPSTVSITGGVSRNTTTINATPILRRFIAHLAWGAALRAVCVRR